MIEAPTRARRWVAFDTETYPIAPGRKAPRMVCLSWCDCTGARGLVNRHKGLKLLKRWLRDPELDIVGLNTAFDLGVAIANDPELEGLVWAAYNTGRVFDVAVFDMLRKIALGSFSWCPVLRREPFFSMADLVEEYFGHKLEALKKGPDVWRTRYNLLDGIPIRDWPEAASSYALNDAVYTAALHSRQLQGVPIHGATYTPATLPDYAPQVRNAWSLHLTGAWGLRTRAEYVAELKERLLEHVNGVIPELVAAGVMRPKRRFAQWELSCGLVGPSDFSKTEAAIRARVEHGFSSSGRPIPESLITDGGQTSIGAEAMFASRDPVLARLASILKDLKELSTYIPILESGAVWPINPGFRVLVASGRTGCRAPNTQNQPRRSGVRECYVARPGTVYLFSDYSAAELCGLAQVCLDRYGWSNLADVLRKGRDPHLVTAAALCGCTYDQIAAAHARGEKWAIDARQLCKIANFGYPGGLMPPTFIDYARGQTRKADGSYPAFIASLDEVASTNLRNVTVGAYPEWELMFAEANRAVAGISGRAVRIQPRSGRIRGGLKRNSWLNTAFQGIVADGAKLAHYAITHECYNVPSSPLYGARPVNFVHDESILEVPEEQAHEANERVNAIQTWAMRSYLPDVPVKVEGACARRWYKGAKPVLVNGRLVAGKPVKTGTRTEWIPDAVAA